MLKEHLEFHELDLSTGWHSAPGYAAGVTEKIISGRLHEDQRRGSRTRLLKFEPGAFTTEPFEHEYWEEVLLVRGTLTVGGVKYPPMTYACRPPHTPHGPFRSDEGCILFEVHYFET